MAKRRKAGPQGVVLFEKWMDLTTWLLERTARFPKRLRHSVTLRLETLTLAVLEDITTASWAADARPALRRASDGLNRLQVLTRLCHELRLFSHGQYEHASEAIADAGRQVGGWLRQQEGAAGGAPQPAPT